MRGSSIIEKNQNFCESPYMREIFEGKRDLRNTTGISIEKYRKRRLRFLLLWSLLRKCAFSNDCHMDMNKSEMIEYVGMLMKSLLSANIVVTISCG